MNRLPSLRSSDVDSIEGKKKNPNLLFNDSLEKEGEEKEGVNKAMPIPTHTTLNFVMASTLLQ